MREHAENDWSTWFHRRLLAEPFDSPRQQRWEPDVRKGGLSVGRRADVAALHDHDIGQDRRAQNLITNPDKVQGREGSLLDVEVNENGTVHLFCGRGSDFRDSEEVLIPVVVAGLVLRVIQLSKRITELTGFVGTWDYAVAVTDLRGVRRHSTGWGDFSPAYSGDEYRQEATADTTELAANPHAIVDRLIGRLLRGLGIDGGASEVLA